MVMANPVVFGGPLYLVQQEQRRGYDKSWFGLKRMVGGAYRGIGHQLARNGKFVIGQGRDEALSGCHGFWPCEINHHFVPST